MRPRILISSGGRFHLFHLCEQLEKRDLLLKFVTCDSVLPSDKIGRNKIKVLYPPLLIDKIYSKFISSGTTFSQQYYYLIKNEIFDWQASHYFKKYFKQADIFVGCCGISLLTLREAKRQVCIRIIERGSAHILYQKGLLEEEYERFGLNFRMPKRLITRQMQEYEEADYISVPSEFVYRTLTAKGVPPKKLIKIPYGVDLKLFKKIPKQDNIFRIIFVGAISLQKGIPYLLQAFRRLRLDNSELILIGAISREIKPILARYDGKFRYLGSLPQRELYQYYSNSSIFVLPSIQEGLAMVIAEAMSCGLPIIATTNTGAEEIVRNRADGYIIPIRDVDALCEKILFFYENEEARIAMGKSAQEHIKNFTWDRYGDRIVENYERLLRERGKL